MIIFFVRRFNDTDHLTPIAYQIKKSTDESVAVFCVNPKYDILHEARLKFLAETYGVLVKYVYEAYCPSLFYRFLVFLLCDKFQHIVIKLALKLPRMLFYNTMLKRLESYFGQDWAVGLLTKYRPSILIFDFVKNSQYITRSLVGAAKHLNIPTVAIPPGATLYEDSLGSLQSFANYDLPDHDYLIMQHETRRRLTIDAGGPEEKMHLLGTPRFCREWENVLDKILAPNPLKKTRRQEKLNVLYIDRPKRDSEDKSAILETISAISKLGFVDLKIKPHTRNNFISTATLKQYGEVAADIESFHLVQWADVVVGTSSSILLEVLCQKKILLYPKYLNNHIMAFEKMNACWQVNSLPELLKALSKIRSNPQYHPYSDANVDRLLTKIVYAGKPDLDVLAAYKDFIMSRAKRPEHLSIHH